MLNECVTVIHRNKLHIYQFNELLLFFESFQTHMFRLELRTESVRWGERIRKKNATEFGKDKVKDALLSEKPTV